MKNDNRKGKGSSQKLPNLMHPAWVPGLKLWGTLMPYIMKMYHGLHSRAAKTAFVYALYNLTVDTRTVSKDQDADQAEDEIATRYRTIKSPKAWRQRLEALEAMLPQDANGAPIIIGGMPVIAILKHPTDRLWDFKLLDGRRIAVGYYWGSAWQISQEMASHADWADRMREIVVQGRTLTNEPPGLDKFGLPNESDWVNVKALRPKGRKFKGTYMGPDRFKVPKKRVNFRKLEIHVPPWKPYEFPTLLSQQELGELEGLLAIREVAIEAQLLKESPGREDTKKERVIAAVEQRRTARAADAVIINRPGKPLYEGGEMPKPSVDIELSTDPNKSPRGEDSLDPMEQVSRDLPSMEDLWSKAEPAWTFRISPFARGEDKIVAVTANYLPNGEVHFVLAKADIPVYRKDGSEVWYYDNGVCTRFCVTVKWEPKDTPYVLDAIRIELRDSPLVLYRVEPYTGPGSYPWSDEIGIYTPTMEQFDKGGEIIQRVHTDTPVVIDEAHACRRVLRSGTPCGNTEFKLRLCAKTCTKCAGEVPRNHLVAFVPIRPLTNLVSFGAKASHLAVHLYGGAVENILRGLIKARVNMREARWEMVNGKLTPVGLWKYFVR